MTVVVIVEMFLFVLVFSDVGDPLEDYIYNW
jgi:hypothetical protein